MKKEHYKTVLVVDDDPDVLGSCSLLLQEYGFNVLSSSGAEDAVIQFRANAVDAVVTDIVMPSVSGIELLRQIHDINPTTPVVLMTAYADIDKVIGAIKTGAFDFIIKPFTADLLVHSVEKAVHYNGLIRMENDYKRLLEEYNQEIEALVAERTMGLVALTLADKIRNPTAVIGLTCKRMIEKDDVPERLRPRLMHIMEETEKLEHIVSEFQSHFKSRKTMFKYEDMNSVIASVIPVVENMVAGKGIELEFRPSDNPLNVNVQRNLFQIALSHIIKNSAESTPVGGRIIISTYEKNDMNVLEVSDTGYGINPEDMDRIFDPVFSSKDRRFGMGLPLVKRIVWEHMGEIDVASRPGKGTTFKISLPIRWYQQGQDGVATAAG